MIKESDPKKTDLNKEFMILIIRKPWMACVCVYLYFVGVCEKFVSKINLFCLVFSPMILNPIRNILSILVVFFTTLFSQPHNNRLPYNTITSHHIHIIINQSIIFVAIFIHTHTHTHWSENKRYNYKQTTIKYLYNGKLLFPSQSMLMIIYGEIIIIIII